MNYLHNCEVERPCNSNLNIHEIQKQTCELSQITMLTSTKAEEMVNKYEVCYYLNVLFNGMSKGQVDVMHNGASSGDQVERVTRYKYFFSQNVPESSSIATEDKRTSF